MEIRYLLFFDLLVDGALLAPFAILLELDLLDHELAVFARPIVGPLADGAAELDELVLGHMWAEIYPNYRRNATPGKPEKGSDARRRPRDG